MTMRLKRLALVLGAAAALAAGGAWYAQASHGGSQGTTLTGCLNPGGQLKNIAVGDEPARPCSRNETLVHLGGGDITAVRTADASGLQGGAESGDADISLQPSYRLPQNCSQDQVPKAVADVWRCAEDDDTDTTYAAGAGLGLDGTTFAVLPPYRLPQGCADGSVAKTSAGTWVCGVDRDTTYTGGTGIDRSDFPEPGFSLNFAYRLPQGCAQGQVAKASSPAGWYCADDIDTDTTYTAGRGLGLDGTAFALGDGYALPQGCAAGEVAKPLQGGWVCAADEDTTYAAADGLELTGSLFGIAQSFRLPQNCGFGATAEWAGVMWVCAADDDTTYTAGDGLTLSGTTFSLDPARGTIQGCAEGEIMKWDGSAWSCAADANTTYDASDFATSGQSCATGSFVKGISANGAVVCAVPDAGGGAGGATISIQALQAGDANCPHGGTAITVDTTTSYACNGAPGPAGPAGPEGPSGGAGVGASPNGVFEIRVTDSGIVIEGPGGNLKIGYSSAKLTNRGTP